MVIFQISYYRLTLNNNDFQLGVLISEDNLISSTFQFTHILTGVIAYCLLYY